MERDVSISFPLAFLCFGVTVNRFQRSIPALNERRENRKNAYTHASNTVLMARMALGFDVNVSVIVVSLKIY